MSYRCQHSGFTVDVEGHFTHDHVWTITTQVRFRKGLRPDERRRIDPTWKRALCRGIEREEIHGRTLGARELRVLLDTALES